MSGALVSGYRVHNYQEDGKYVELQLLKAGVRGMNIPCSVHYNYITEKYDVFINSQKYEAMKISG